MKKIFVLGSTGSIGTQTLDVIKNNGDELGVSVLAAKTNYKLIYSQLKSFKPDYVCLVDKDSFKNLLDLVSLDGYIKKGQIPKALENGKISIVLDKKEICLCFSNSSLIELIKKCDYDTIVTATVGISGLIPTLEAIKRSKTIALANKETMVTAGGIVLEEARKAGAKIIPVDSEHSAIFQCLQGEKPNKINKILLTASGGPFRGKKKEELINVTKDQALKHPNWSMGRKISIDSATLMNKGLEIIEACWLFNIGLDKVQVLVHPQSIVHSAVEFEDSSVIAQLGTADMRTPIQYALLYPKRKDMGIKSIDLFKIANLSFEEVDEEIFPCLSLAKEAFEKGMSMCTVLNAANEVLVDMFLNDKISFYDISKYIKIMMQEHEIIDNPTIDDIIRIDLETRNKIIERVK